MLVNRWAEWETCVTLSNFFFYKFSTPCVRKRDSVNDKHAVVSFVVFARLQQSLSSLSRYVLLRKRHCEFSRLTVFSFTTLFRHFARFYFQTHVEYLKENSRRKFQFVKYNESLSFKKKNIFISLF